MDSRLKQRLVGAAVLVALAVIFLPMLVQGPAPDSGVSDVPLSMPDAPRGDYETRDLPLVRPATRPMAARSGCSPRRDSARGGDAIADIRGHLPNTGTFVQPPPVPLGQMTSARQAEALPRQAAELDAPAPAVTAAAITRCISAPSRQPPPPTR